MHNSLSPARRRLSAALALCSLAIVACAEPEVEPQSSSLLASCVGTTNLGTGMSLQRIINYLEGRGATVTLDSTGEPHVLRSVMADPLTDKAQRLDLEIVLQQTARQGGGPAACGPDRAEVTRISTNATVLDGPGVDAVVAELAQDVAAAGQALDEGPTASANLGAPQPVRP